MLDLRSISKLAVRAWAQCSVAGLVTGAAIYLISGPLPLVADVDPGVGYWLSSILFAPLAETLLLWPMLRYLPMTSANSKALFAGVFWGALHAIQRGPIGWATAGPFVVLSSFFLVVDGRNGPKAAVWLTSLVHALYNLSMLGLVHGVAAGASS